MIVFACLDATNVTVWIKTSDEEGSGNTYQNQSLIIGGTKNQETQKYELQREYLNGSPDDCNFSQGK